MHLPSQLVPPPRFPSQYMISVCTQLLCIWISSLKLSTQPLTITSLSPSPSDCPYTFFFPFFQLQQLNLSPYHLSFQSTEYFLSSELSRVASQGSPCIYPYPTLMQSMWSYLHIRITRITKKNTSAWSPLLEALT